MELKVCIGDYCHLNGSEIVVRRFKELISENGLDAKIILKGCFCMNKCQEKGVSVQIGEKKYKVDPCNVDNFFESTVRISN